MSGGGSAQLRIADYQHPKVILRALRRPRVAVVGLSGNELRASNFVGRYLLRHGYDMVPVNPREERILGRRSYPCLEEIPDPVDTVDVFRHPDAVPDIASSAVAIGAEFLWLQYNVISADGVKIAEAGGLEVVMDRCMKVEHARYMGRMHWLGFNTGRITARRTTPV